MATKVRVKAGPSRLKPQAGNESKGWNAGVEAAAKGEKPVTAFDVALANRVVQLRESDRFHRLFGVHLHKPYWDNLTRLDVGAFDKLIQCPDGISTQDHLLANPKWGKAAVEFVKSLF